jgi:hypothetical protein
MARNWLFWGLSKDRKLQVYELLWYGQLMTRLRDLGDNRTLVLHTDENRVYMKLRDSAKLIKLVPYEQEQGGKATLVAVDLYFPKKCRNWLEKIIGINGP